MSPFITQALLQLYGPSTGPQVAETIATKLEAVRVHPAARLGPATSKPTTYTEAELSQRDALLICYADQLREPETPPLRTLGRFAQKHLRDCVSGLHILPFYPWSSDDGFSVKDYLTVDPAYGSWDDIAGLAADFDLMFDAVVNHASVQGEWFKRFLANDPAYRDFFITISGNHDLSQVVRPRALPLLTEFQTTAGPRRVWTTFSADQADLNFKNPAVLLAVLDALLCYAAKGARFIRLDAIAFLWKEIGTSCLHRPETHLIIQLFRVVLNEAAPRVQLITETNVPHADNVSYFGDGSNEAQLVYNFALPPLVLHSLQTGRAEKLSAWAKSLVLPSDRVAFFNFLASHDGIGLNPARDILSDEEIEAMVARAEESGGFVSYKSMPDGSSAPYELNVNFLDALSPPAKAEPVGLAARKFVTAHAMMFCLQGVPGIYFHSLFGSRGDPDAARSSGIKRRINRAKLHCADLERQLKEPSSLRAAIFGGCSALLRSRRLNPCFSPAASQRIVDSDARVFAVLREPADGVERLLCLHNVSSDTVMLRPGPLLLEPVELPPFGFRWLPLSAG